jgi:hypothetical protein
MSKHTHNDLFVDARAVVKHLTWFRVAYARAVRQYKRTKFTLLIFVLRTNMRREHTLMRKHTKQRYFSRYKHYLVNVCDHTRQLDVCAYHYRLRLFWKQLFFWWRLHTQHWPHSQQLYEHAARRRGFRRLQLNRRLCVSERVCAQPFRTHKRRYFKHIVARLREREHYYKHIRWPGVCAGNRKWFLHRFVAHMRVLIRLRVGVYTHARTHSRRRLLQRGWKQLRTHMTARRHEYTQTVLVRRQIKHTHMSRWVTLLLFPLMCAKMSTHFYRKKLRKRGFAAWSAHTQRMSIQALQYHKYGRMAYAQHLAQSFFRRYKHTQQQRADTLTRGDTARAWLLLWVKARLFVRKLWARLEQRRNDVLTMQAMSRHTRKRYPQLAHTLYAHAQTTNQPMTARKRRSLLCV